MNEAGFHALAEDLYAGLDAGEILLLELLGEDSDFLRFSQARFRQGGRVHQAEVELRLIRGRRQARARSTVAGDPAIDRPRLRRLVAGLRAQLPHLPEDPFLLYDREPARRSRRDPGTLPAAAEVAGAVAHAADGLDLVGIWAAGSLQRGFASSLGHRLWHESGTFNFDWSCHLPAGQAVKQRYAGSRWDAEGLRARLEGARDQLAVMARPPVPASRGTHRAYLAPMALAGLLDMLQDGAFGLDSLRTRRSPLLRLAQGTRRLSPRVTLEEHTARGLAPDFTGEGFPKPPRVRLVTDGRLGEPLVAARSAAEYGTPVNCDFEAPESLDLLPGELREGDIAGALGDGLWINNLWYCNWSDRNDCRITGMTRYACLRVSGGEVIGQVAPMRFDDSLLDLLGERLEGLSDTREEILQARTYGGRSLGSQRLPGALVAGLRLTL